MLTMPIYNSQVAIAGRVLDKETQQAIAGAIVKIIEMPDKFRKQLSLKELQSGSQWEKISDRADRKITASDGYFYFVDLPTGDYKLEVSVNAIGTDSQKGEQIVHVASHINQVIPTTMTNIFL